MKLLALVTLALSLVACDSKQSTSSKKCTFNDAPVECSETNQQQGSGSISLYAEVSSKIMIFDDFLEIKERNTNFNEETINGVYRRCEVSTNDIMGFHFQYDEENLYIKMRINEEPVIYKRINGNPDSLYGSWKISEIVEGQVENTILKISENNIQIITECKFKQ